MFKLVSRQFTRKTVNLINARCQSSYIILLPEDPIDSADNNALIRLAEGQHPEFSNLTAEKCYSGLGRLCIDFECGLWDIEETIRDKSSNVSISDVIEPLDKLDASLNAGWSAAKTLYIARQDILPQKKYLGVHERARKARVHKYHSLPVYNACKSIKTNQSNTLNTCEQRIVSKFCLESRLNGIELDPRKASQFVDIIKSLDQDKTQFRQKVAMSTHRFSFKLPDDVVSSFPEDIRKRMSSTGSDKGPFFASLRPDVYEPFLSHCRTRALRFNAWQAYNMRANKKMDEHLDNSVNVENIRKNRQEQAALLGYDTFASMSMETKMAGSVETVQNTIGTLKAAALPAQEREMGVLSQFASQEGFSGDALQAYDVPYYSNLYRQRHYGLSANLREYLPFDHVWEVLLQLTSQLFGIEFEEEESPDRLLTWHSSVRLFNVIDGNGGKIASFYLDPFRREGVKLNTSGNSGWTISLRGRSTQCQTPSTAIILNLSDGMGSTPLLSLEDTVLLFSKFGESLQHLLSTTPYGEASGLSNVEWDAMAMTQHFMANWIFVPEVLSSLCRHHETGEGLTEAQIQEVIRLGNHMAGHTLCKQLYKSQLDLDLHTKSDFWSHIQADLWPQFLPYQLDKNDVHVCSFTECLADVWAAAYYSHIWARMMAADCTKAFLEEGDWANTGKRFRDTFLAIGGGEHSAEVFRKFRGRDISTTPLLELYGIAKP